MASLAQGHAASRWQSWDLNLGLTCQVQAQCCPWSISRVGWIGSSDLDGLEQETNPLVLRSLCSTSKITTKASGMENRVPVAPPGSSC